jgi:hypothetical protein
MAQCVMRPGWRVHLWGPFYLADTIWQSKRRRRRGPVCHGPLPDGWKCPRDHRREDTAIECADREARSRARG